MCCRSVTEYLGMAGMLVDECQSETINKAQTKPQYNLIHVDTIKTNL